MSSFGGYDLSSTDGVSAALGALFQDPTLLPETMTSWLNNYIQTWTGTNLSIDQISGYQQQSVTSNLINALETSSTSTSAYQDLHTVGPVLTGLSDGTYNVNYAAMAMVSSGNSRARMNISVNGAAPDDTKTMQAYTQVSSGMVGISGLAVVVLNAGTGNSIKLQYSCPNTSYIASFDKRYLSAQRVSN